MTYSPGSPGYPPAQPTTQYGAPSQQYGKGDDGLSKLPVYLTAAVAVLGLAVYIASFGPMFTLSSSDFPQLGSASGSTLGLGLAVVAALVAALLAGVSLLPKQSKFAAVVAVISVIAFLLVLAEVINKPRGVSIDWALYLVIAFTALQAILAVTVLLFDAGIVTPSAQRPKYDQQQYGQYGPGGYYGQPGPQVGRHGGPPQQQRPGYPTQYGGQPGGPSTGGFSALPDSGPPTPPTGFPTYGQPQGTSSAPTTRVPAQPQSSSTQESGPTPS